MNLEPDAASTIVGYRVVRRLGSGSRADVYLGAGETGSRALKVFHEGISTDDIGAEIAALSRVSSVHCVRLVDVGSGSDGRPVLILERVPRGSVASLVRERSSLEAGEVVTLLAPIAREIASLHGLGVAHGRLGLANLHVGTHGEPVLLGFGHSEVFEAGLSIAAIEAHPAAAHDRAALRMLSATLLSHVRTSGADTLRSRLLDWLDGAANDFEFPLALEERLFDLAEPIPLAVAHRDAPTRVAASLPGRLGTGSSPSPLSSPSPSPWTSPPPEAEAEAETREADTLVATDRSEGTGLVQVLHDLLAENPFEVVRRRVVGFARGVRKPIWVATGAIVVAFVLALALLPSGASVHATAPQTDVPTSRPVSIPSALPADPVAALEVLLRKRNACVRARTVLCLDDVDEASSGAYDDDAELIEELQGGSEIPRSALVEPSSLSLTELLGDSALIRLAPSANGSAALVLMIRDQSGWRIRSYLSGVPSTGTPSAPG